MHISRKTEIIALLVCFLVLCGGVAGSTILMSPSDTETVLKTSNSAQPIRFAAAGDFGAQKKAKDVLELIQNENPDFTLALGDLSYGELTESEWCTLVKTTLGTTHPFQIVAGNHDTADTQGDINMFSACLPNRMPNMQGTYGHNYYFDSNNLARFIMISPDIELKNASYSFTQGSQDFKWLKQAIEDAQSLQIPWIIVGMHKNCITIGEKECEIGTDLLDLLSRERVDLVLQGHEHGYSRTKQLTLNGDCISLQPKNFMPECVNEGENNQIYQKGEGPILAIPGTGGAPLRNIQTDRAELPYFAYWSGANVDPGYGPLIVEITNKELSAYFSRTDGTKKDTFKIVATD